MTTFDLKHQTVELPGTRRPGQTGIYRRAGYENALISTPVKNPQVKTVYDAFQNGLRISANKPFLGTRRYDPVTKDFGEYEWQTYFEVHDRITRFGSGLVKIHQDVHKLPEAAQRWTLGIWAINRAEWTIASEACSAYNMVTVGLYDTLGPDAVVYGINHSECSVAVTSADHVASLLSDSDKMPGLKVVISMDPLDSIKERPGVPVMGSVLRTYAKDKGVLLYDWSEVEAIGAEFNKPHTPATPSDIYTICYTSGTTGMPKGALLSHENFIAIAASVDVSIPLIPEDCLISFLPLAHVFGRLMELFAFHAGASIGYSTGDQLKLLEDLAYLKPTFFPAVPRLLNRVYAKIRESTVDAPGLTGVLSRKAFDVKLANLKAGNGFTHAFWDRILFSKVKKALGGNVRVILTASAPISAEVMTFLKIALCTEILEAYGQTEGTGGAMSTAPGSTDAGHVGAPLVCCEYKLMDVPELSYFAIDRPFPRGEICVRGKGVFRGYLKDEVKTKETLDEEGWLYTGDIGYVRDDGVLVIIDRKKNVFKLSQGEYIAVENIEGKYQSGVPFVQQILIHGDSKESFVVAIIVPEPEPFVTFVNKVLGTNIKFTDHHDIVKACQNPKLIKAVQKVVDKVGKEAGLKGFEIPKAVLLETEPFTIENDMMTPTFKLKRHQIVKKYSEELTDLYKEAHKNSSKL